MYSPSLLVFPCCAEFGDPRATPLCKEVAPLAHGACCAPVLPGTLARFFHHNPLRKSRSCSTEPPSLVFSETAASISALLIRFCS